MRTHRRRCLKTLLQLGAIAGASGTWPSRLAGAMANASQRRHLVVLWMPGGPSQIDTFDMKPGTAQGGPFQELKTSVPGMAFSEHLKGLSEYVEHLAIIRSMQTREGDHARGTYLLRTGQRPGNPIRYPSISCSLAKELSEETSTIPGYVSVLPNALINPSAFGAGFLGANREPLTVGSNSAANAGSPVSLDNSQDTVADLRVDNLIPPARLDRYRIQRRQQFWELLQSQYGASARPGPALTHDTVYRRAMQLAESDLLDAFDLKQESDETRARYGLDTFGQGCLMARRLIERGVSVVEVSLSDGLQGLSWDSHADNFAIVRRLSERLDRSWSQLLKDLKQSGLLEQTTFAWMGEFGRTPQINEMGGRDHFPNAWSCVLGGAGVVGGSVVGKTSPDGMEVVDRPVSAADLLATLSWAVGVDPDTENINEDRRPIKIVEGSPIREILT